MRRTLSVNPDEEGMRGWSVTGLGVNVCAKHGGLGVLRSSFPERERLLILLRREGSVLKSRYTFEGIEGLEKVPNGKWPL